MTDYILFKNLDGKYMTLPECLEVNKTGTRMNPKEGAVDENGEKGRSRSRRGQERMKIPLRKRRKTRPSTM